jgi:hypothetical protein
LFFYPVDCCILKMFSDWHRYNSIPDSGKFCFGEARRRIVPGHPTRLCPGLLDVSQGVVLFRHQAFCRKGPTAMQLSKVELGASASGYVGDLSAPLQAGSKEVSFVS